jgi:hypothetical protein
VLASPLASADQSPNWNVDEDVSEWVLLEAHREMCGILASMGLPGAQSERFVNVAGFMVKVDVTLQVNWQVVLIPCA